MNKVQLFMIGILFMSCSNRPEWIDKDPELNDFKLDSVYFNNFRFDDNAILLSDIDLLKIHGEPISHDISAGFLPDSFCEKSWENRRQGAIRFWTNDYEGYYFAPINKQNKLIYVDFSKTDKILTYDDFDFSAKTKAKDFKKRFPWSDFYKNSSPNYVYSLSSFDSFVDSTIMNDIEDKGYDFLYLNIVGRKCSPAIEVTFVDNKLRYLKFLP